MAAVSGEPAIHVLVVDDDARVRHAVHQLLDDAGGLQCLAVDSGQAMRLAMWGSVGAHVAVVDVPSGSGPCLALAGRLARLLPVVVVSMSASTRASALAAGALGFVEKDGDAGVLVDAIRAAADGEPESMAPKADPRQNVVEGEQEVGPVPSSGPSGEAAR